VVIVDDALLLALLAEQEGVSEALLITGPDDGEVFTTRAWYWRLGRVLARPGRGALSRAFAASSEDEQRRVRHALDQLPAEIGLLSMRRLVPVMAALPGQLNLLQPLEPSPESASPLHLEETPESASIPDEESQLATPFGRKGTAFEAT
jgi:hypothetical protein